MARTSGSAHVLTDHEKIRRWAEDRGARPSCVRGTGGGDDVGMIRLDFPGYSGENSLQFIEWDEWFQKFDESNLALLVQDKTAGGQKSNFNKLVSRDTAEERNEMQEDQNNREEGRSGRSGRRSARGRASTRTTRSGGTRRRSTSARSRRSSASGRSRNTRSSARNGRSQTRSSRATGRKTNANARGSRRASTSSRKRSGSVRESSRRRAA